MQLHARQQLHRDRLHVRHRGCQFPSVINSRDDGAILFSLGPLSSQLSHRAYRTLDLSRNPRRACSLIVVAFCWLRWVYEEVREVRNMTADFVLSARFDDEAVPRTFTK